MNIKYIAFLIAGVILLFAIAIIIFLRSKRNSITSSVYSDDLQNADIIQRLSDKKKKSLETKPWTLKYSTYKLLAVCGACIFAVCSFVFLHNIWLSMLFAIIGLLVPEAIIAIKSNTAKADFEERYSTSLKQLVASLKSGLSISQAVENVCSSPYIHDSIKKEYEILDADLKLGISAKEAFNRFAERIDCEDAKDVAIAIGMQSSIGGKEAASIESVAKNISERIMLRKEVKSMFAGTNATVVTMDIAPFIIVLFMYISVPGYLAPFFSSTIMLLLFIALLLVMGVGSIVVHNEIKKMKKECGV